MLYFRITFAEHATGTGTEAMASGPPRLLATTLIRAIFRTAKAYDDRHALRVLLSAPRDREYDLCLGTWSSIEPAAGASSADSDAASVLDDATRRLCNGARLYPGLASAEPPSLRTALKAAIRSHQLPGDGRQAQQRGVDAGFALLRRLEGGITLGERVLAPIALVEPASAARPRRPAHDLSAGPAAGDLLASHPLLRRDVVMVLSADGPDGFAMGLVTNNPTHLRLGSSPSTTGRGRSVGPPPRKALPNTASTNTASTTTAPLAAVASAPAVSTPAPTEQWTTGRRQLTDELASQVPSPSELPPSSLRAPSEHALTTLRARTDLPPTSH